MLEEINAYFEYLSNFHEVEIPRGSKYDYEVFAHADYLDIISEFDNILDFNESVDLDIDYLEGE